MADAVWPPLDPYLRESLLLYRSGFQQLRALEAHNNLASHVIEVLQWWANKGDLDVSQQGRVGDILALFQGDLIVNAYAHESLRQRSGRQRRNLHNWVMNSPLVQNPRLAILCRTARDVDAVHTLSLLGNWPQPPRHLFKVGIDWRLHNNDPAPPRRLADYAMSLNCEVYNIW